MGGESFVGTSLPPHCYAVGSSLGYLGGPGRDTLLDEGPMDSEKGAFTLTWVLSRGQS